MINNKLQSGFTLIEMLMVVALLAIFSIAVSQVLFMILRSQTKGEVNKEVKQNGDYAFSVMEQMTRNAVDIGCGSNTFYQIKNPDGLVTTFSCSGGQISSNSANLTSTNVNVSGCAFTVVCPAIVGSSPKYVYISYTVSQGGSGGGPAQSSSAYYQGTVSLLNY